MRLTLEGVTKGPILGPARLRLSTWAEVSLSSRLSCEDN